MKTTTAILLAAVILGHSGAGDHVHTGAGSKPVVMTTPRGK